MEKIFSIVTILLLLLSSCSTDWNNRKDNGNNELENRNDLIALELQEKCADKAKVYFETDRENQQNIWRDWETLTNQNDFQNHYSYKYKKCFILEYFILLDKNNHQFFVRYLDDIFAHSNIGAYSDTYDPTYPTNNKVVSCSIVIGKIDKSCTSGDDFDDLAKEYMEN